VNWGSTKRAILSCFEVLDIAYTITGPGVTGEIQSAGITLRGPLIYFDCMRIEPMLAKLRDVFKHSKKHRFYRHELDDRHTSHCTESATTGEIVYKIIRWGNSGQGVKYSNKHSGQFALVVAVEEEEDKCLFLAIVVKETKPDTWIRLGWIKIHTKEYFDTKYAWQKAEGNTKRNTASA
jgi:hypothetical protein